MVFQLRFVNKEFGRGMNLRKTLGVKDEKQQQTPPLLGGGGEFLPFSARFYSK